MNGKDIIWSLKHVSDSIVEEAEYGAFLVRADNTVTKERSHRLFHRPFLVAAMIALTLLLVGCAVVYVLSMEKVKIGETTETVDYRLVEGTYVEDPHEVSQNVLTLAGLKGSKPYQACADFFAFKDEYTRNMEAMMENGTLPEGFLENDTYGKAMDAKAEELAEEYSLKLEGEALGFRTTRNLCDALGIERLMQDSQEVSAVIDMGSCYENGNFRLYLDFTFPGDKGYEVSKTNGTLRWNRADCFSTDYATIINSGDWSERNYTTSSGSEVLILRSPSQERGYIICDRGEALMSLELNMNPEILSEADGITTSEFLHMTDKQIEFVADMMDFGIQPKTPTQADVDNQQQIPSSATQNGYTLTLKSVETDGYVAHILVTVTAPEGMDIDSLKIGTGMSFDEFEPMSGQVSSGSGAFNDLPDSDGLANTQDLLMEAERHMVDNTMPFAIGSEWRLHIVDLWVNKYEADERILVEGEWFIPITFDETNSDSREIELLSEPIQAKAYTGWTKDGKDVIHEFTVTSFKLRKFSSSIEWETVSHMGDDHYGDSADFYAWRGHRAHAVMKDGTQIELLQGRNGEPVDLDQVDHVFLADGTKLIMPKN